MPNRFNIAPDRTYQYRRIASLQKQIHADKERLTRLVQAAPFHQQPQEIEETRARLHASENALCKLQEGDHDIEAPLPIDHDIPM